MIEGIPAELERLGDCFPTEAMEEAIAHREQITPVLLGILEDTVERAEELCADFGHIAHLHAMYLLAQFRETRAYRPLARLLSLPQETIAPLMWYMEADDTHRILASVCGGDDTILKRLVRDTRIGDQVRASALKAMTVLFVNGQKSRVELVAYFRSLFHGGLERTHGPVWDELVSACVDIYPQEFTEEISQCFEEGLVDEHFLSEEAVEGVLEDGIQRSLELLKLSPDYTFIDDAIAEMEGWVCFEPEPEYDEPRKPSAKKVKKEIEAREKEIRAMQRLIRKPESEDTYKPSVAPSKMGRNDPCPCGSGKKYKKCCGNPALADRKEA
ncbi:MAG: DUF1186 domain-containing protein [Thermodesulfobacteriota bacterium]